MELRFIDNRKIGFFAISARTGVADDVTGLKDIMFVIIICDLIHFCIAEKDLPGSWKIVFEF